MKKGKFIFFTIFGLFSVFGRAEILQRIETLQEAPVYAQIGKEFRQVATFNAHQIFSALTEQNTETFVAMQFGNAVGFVETRFVESKLPLETTYNAEKANPLTGYILTSQPTPIYETVNGEIEAQLVAGLRYPIIENTRDSEGKLWYAINFAGKIAFLNAKDVQIDKGIPIITYHHILQEQENKNFRSTSTTVSEKAFRFQMKTIKELGFESVNLDAIEGYLKGKVNLPAKVMVITFDDGLTSAYRYGYPILKEYGFSATMFVITSRIKYDEQPWNANSLQFLSYGEYDKMADIFDYQSHTHFLHRYLNKKPIAIQRSYHNLIVDFEHSMRELTALNSSNAYISYPFGGYNALVIQAAKNVGFRLGLTTKVGKVKFGNDPFQLKRVYLLTNSTAEQIAKTLEN